MRPECCLWKIPEMKMELIRENIIRIVVKINEIEVNLSPFLNAMTDRSVIPHNKVVVINETGVEKLFHVPTEGIMYSLIMLNMRTILKNNEIKEKIIPILPGLNLYGIYRDISKDAINKESANISLLSQLFPRLFIA